MSREWRYKSGVTCDDSGKDHRIWRRKKWLWKFVRTFTVATFDKTSGTRIFDHSGRKLFGLFTCHSFTGLPPPLRAHITNFHLMPWRHLRSSPGVFRQRHEERLQEVALRRNHHSDLAPDGFCDADTSSAGVILDDSDATQFSTKEKCRFPEFSPPNVKILRQLNTELNAWFRPCRYFSSRWSSSPTSAAAARFLKPKFYQFGVPDVGVEQWRDWGIADWPPRRRRHTNPLHPSRSEPQIWLLFYFKASQIRKKVFTVHSSKPTQQNVKARTISKSGRFCDVQFLPDEQRPRNGGRHLVPRLAR